jgi:hypothetical protein
MNTDKPRSVVCRGPASMPKSTQRQGCLSCRAEMPVRLGPKHLSLFASTARTPRNSSFLSRTVPHCRSPHLNPLPKGEAEKSLRTRIPMLSGCQRLCCTRWRSCSRRRRLRPHRMLHRGVQPGSSPPATTLFQKKHAGATASVAITRQVGLGHAGGEID